MLLLSISDLKNSMLEFYRSSKGIGLLGFDMYAYISVLCIYISCITSVYQKSILQNLSFLFAANSNCNCNIQISGSKEIYTNKPVPQKGIGFSVLESLQIVLNKTTLS